VRKEDEEAVTIQITYDATDGPKKCTLSLPSWIEITHCSPSWPETAMTDNDIAATLDLPFEPGPKTLFIINDLDRPTPTEKILTALTQRYPRVPDADIVVATGAHTPSHPAEKIKKELLGDVSSAFSGGFFIHSARDSRTFFAGITSRGTRVEVSRILLDHEQIITIGSIEPHWFAGYTGGRKSIIPGIASFETIRTNHRLATEEGVGPLMTTTNPVFEDLDEAARLTLDTVQKSGCSEVFGINAVGHGEDIYDVAVRPLMDSLDPLIPTVDAIYKGERDPADIVIAIAATPMDRDLYQAMKSFENLRGVLRRDASFILIASCIDGVGPPHFSQTLVVSEDLLKVSQKLSGGYSLGDHKFKNPLKHRETGGSLSVVSEHLASSGAKTIGFFSLFSDIQKALDHALKRITLKEGKRALIATDAVNLVVFPTQKAVQHQ
jgi:nickel-dependent lactate racemase